MPSPTMGISINQIIWLKSKQKSTGRLSNFCCIAWHQPQADPNSVNHFSCFSISAWETLRWTFRSASSKSHIATGSFEISSLDMFLISSRVFPAILRLIPFNEASRQTLVRSSPLYPSVRRATSSMFTSAATCGIKIANQ